MSRNELPRLCIAVLLMLVSIGLAQERAQSPDAARAGAEKAMRDALKVMRDADKLTDTQVDELHNMVFPKEIDWDVRYEAFLKENPAVADAVKSGTISKEKVIAGIMSREGERPPTEEEQLEALYQKLLKDDPSLGRPPKAAPMPRLKAMLARGEGKNLRPENSTRQRTMSFGLYLNGLIESGQVERFDKDLKRVHDVGAAEIQRQGRPEERGQAADQARGRRLREDVVDWDAQYKRFLNGNPAVKAAVASGRVTKKKVLAGMKARAQESNVKYYTHVGAELKGKYAYKKRWRADALARAEGELKRQAEVGGYLKQVLQAIERTLIEVHIEGEHFVVDPEVSSHLQKLGLTDEQITLVVGLGQKAWVDVVDMNMGVSLQEYSQILSAAKGANKSGDPDPRLVGALQFSMDSGNRALMNHFDSVVEQGILTREEADALLKSAKVESIVDWDAMYEQFLKDNPKIRVKVETGEWTREQVMTLIKIR